MPEFIYCEKQGHAFGSFASNAYPYYEHSDAIKCANLFQDAIVEYVPADRYWGEVYDGKPLGQVGLRSEHWRVKVNNHYVSIYGKDPLTLDFSKSSIKSPL